jgi:4-hydroxyacetophenone monooxygenase
MNKQFESPARLREPVDRAELLAATDAEIDAAVKLTDAMALRGAIYQLSGDEEIAAAKVTKQIFGFSDVYAPATPEDAAIIQGRAAAFLKKYRDEGAPPISPGPADRLARSLALTAGQEIDQSELTMWLEELALDPWSRGLKWKATPPAKALADFKVMVIGTGLNGLGAAVQLQHAGIPFEMIDKNPEIGGTWWENRYPGARVDSPSRTYTHIFGADYIYDYAFCPRADNQRYIDWVGKKFNLRDSIHFSTTVKSMAWDEGQKKWKITVEGLTGEKTLWANAIVNATGIFNIANVPDVAGAETFKGDSFHSSRVPLDYDFKGKRVAVVGTGASGYQMIPEMVKIAGHVTVFQRRPQWLFPTPGYLGKLPVEVPWLDRNLPLHNNFMRFRQNWLIGEHVIAKNAIVDPEWKDPHTRSAFNHKIREMRVAYVREKFADHPELIDKMIPPHPPFSARPVLVDETYNVYDAILKDNCDLVTTTIERLVPEGIVSDGKVHKVDVIVWATGFKTSDILSTIQVTGRGGLDLQKVWAKDGARAYAGGSMVPGFPNFFMLYGPNTNLGSGGGIINVGEVSMTFALERMAELILDNKRTVEVTQKGFDDYNAELDALEKTRIYVDPRAQNYYVNEHNRSVVNCPFPLRQVWQQLHDVPPNHLKFE